MEPSFHFRKTALICAINIGLLGELFGATNGLNVTNLVKPIEPPPTTARGLYNAGTRELAGGRLDEAEMLLQSAVATQDERVQSRALYNLGSVRFGQGTEALKQETSAKSTTARSGIADDTASRAIQFAETALEGTNLQRMVVAYLNGRGARREIRSATEAVQHAMEVHGDTLIKWRRAAGDFMSAAELNPADTNAMRNARIVERAIARLVDSIHELQQMAMKGGEKSAQLNELMKQLKGRIPQDMMPPGAPGDDEEDLPMESWRGRKEGPAQEGRKSEFKLSREQAGQFLDGVRLNESRRLPVVEGDKGLPENRSGRTW
jgi:tetratricopeptide (TPR) repeat protein